MESKNDQPGENRSVKNFRLKRRALLGTIGVTAVLALTRTVKGQIVPAQLSNPAPLHPDPTKVPGVVPGKIGTRSDFEKLVKKPSDTSSRTPLQDLYGIITPSDLHFERNHNGVPNIDPGKYELLIHGMVDKPMVFTLKDLK